jgi:hypothetical protein
VEARVNSGQTHQTERSVFIGVGIGLACFVIPGIFIWIWQVKDAYTD